ncbi:E2-like enzyme [Yamadazyma tenuis]|uniref:Autophagy-related protein 3 n=1 Tax=Candida tenuis (strain ATCC 10573 / BCRC 21748 / CBS 615 / JCM 9827 / NBRC 10315 / NRRL Y-1498 / VKM Y-70) TaxID=590646 RepID=G3AY30_CANTC|nr:uncharacterized protein CANTEDRAFT_112618 [Yamadazyma tenuis ATCC 10573]XP_006684735.1 uncharacterized protein CANTEDRAFT_112618 [Yamadazyma tenuis ATCC 10573]EGV66160.1 hypothetical protein CANTEDRAFT_112618 [Yamadazyma tenuis ATCC 10573]EGV66161.1 hypothetical protein CANTEDRAFT_112618 [Yamadazyma tenuis ATCC 10573]WEJ95921.1 E2-like enzyme [Yamadazyma tenuis]
MSIRSKLSSLRDYLTPINNTSNFTTTGEISPDEFVIAGDYLVYKFPTWEWSSAPSKLQKSYLPPDKQYLITKHVPSHERAYTYLGIDATLDESEEELEDGWVKSHKISESAKSSDSIDDAKPSEIQDNDHNDNNDIDDLIDETAELELAEDEFEDLSKGNHSSLRKYDLYITYSTSYRVPKLYLVGFSSSGIPLLPKQMFEDISSDYRDRTATIEKLPTSFNTTSVSIHPCKHASVMRVLMEHAKQSQLKRKLKDRDEDDESEDVKPKDEDEDDELGVRADQYLIIFLKFIASVTPGIEYDYTMEVL